MINIFLRTCDKVDSLHGVPRPFGLSKKDVIKVCFKSLMKAFEGKEYKLHIIADDLAEDTIQFYKETSDPTKTFIYEGKWGNDASLMRMFELSETVPDAETVYYLEDDYLHNPEHFVETLTEITDKNVFFHPTDYPDQYFRKDLIIPTYVGLGTFTHWRRVSSSTFTFAGKSSLMKKYMSHMKSSTVGANDGFLSQIFNETAILCPIPGMATHMHEGTMSPFVEWKDVIQSLENKETRYIG